MRAIILFLLVISSMVGQTIKVGVGISLEPYIIQKNDSGIELDIVKTVLHNAGYEVKIKYLPFLRIPSYLDENKIDAATTINEDSDIKNIYYSNTHITYQNVIVSLKSSHLNISKVEDLENLKIISFQNANKYLGYKFQKVIPKLKFYQELANQTLQVKLLFAKRVDAIILDINIFKYIKNHIKQLDTNQDVIIFKVFPKTNYKVGFLDPLVRDKFNIELGKLKASGLYQQMFNKYIGQGLK